MQTVKSQELPKMYVVLIVIAYKLNTLAAKLKDFFQYVSAMCVCFHKLMLACTLEAAYIFPFRWRGGIGILEGFHKV